jgi:hypothetical protein
LLISLLFVSSPFGSHERLQKWFSPKTRKGFSTAGFCQTFSKKFDANGALCCCSPLFSKKRQKTVSFKTPEGFAIDWFWATFFQKAELSYKPDWTHYVDKS